MSQSTNASIRPQTITDSHSSDRQRPGRAQAHRRHEVGRRLRSLPLLCPPEQQCVGDAAEDQGKFHLEQRRGRVLHGTDGKQQRARNDRERKTRHSDRDQDARERPDRHRRPASHQPQIERNDGAEQKRDADDMAGVDSRVAPACVAQFGDERQVLQRRKPFNQHRSPLDQLRSG